MEPNSKLMDGALLGIGNPLLDISANVDGDLLIKYGLKPNDAVMAEERHMPLYEELLKRYHVEYIAGGSVQNTLRLVVWVLKQKKVCTYIGCVGKDQFADTLKGKLHDDGVVSRYQVDPTLPTGTCAVLLTADGQNRSLCANLAAAQRFDPAHLDTPECQTAIFQARCFYTSGFFLAVSVEAVLRLARAALAGKHPFALNLSAPFVPAVFKQALVEVMPYVDLLFGNESEAIAFSEAFGFGQTDIPAIAKKIAAMPKKDKERPRIVVITQGCEPVVLTLGGQVSEMPVVSLPPHEVVDTNGAGDGFAAGFLAQFIRGMPEEACVRCGVYVATEVIRNSGCTVRGDCEFKC